MWCLCHSSCTVVVSWGMHTFLGFEVVVCSQPRIELCGRFVVLNAKTTVIINERNGIVHTPPWVPGVKKKRQFKNKKTVKEPWTKL